MVHTHCHQKALPWPDATRRVLDLVDDICVTEIDAECCGMVGSFGYEHYDVSLAVADPVHPQAGHLHQRPPDTAWQRSVRGYVLSSSRNPFRLNRRLDSLKFGGAGFGEMTGVTCHQQQVHDPNLF